MGRRELFSDRRLARRGFLLEDTCWLRPVNDAAHINLAELVAVLNGVDLALQWLANRMHLRSDLLCVYLWISDTLTGKVRIWAKAKSEMLIRRRLETIKKLVTAYGLSMDVTLIASKCDLAGRLTRVPQRWFDMFKREVRPRNNTCAASMEEREYKQVKSVHQRTRHPGVKRTWYFAK